MKLYKSTMIGVIVKKGGATKISLNSCVPFRKYHILEKNSNIKNRYKDKDTIVQKLGFFNRKEKIMKLGALPPKEVEWQLGKTLVTIDFVNEVEEVIKKLQMIVEEIKNGKRKISEYTTLMSIIYDKEK